MTGVFDRSGLKLEMLFRLTPFSARVYKGRYGADRTALETVVMIEPYVSMDGKFGVAYRAPGSASRTGIESDLLLGYADSWRASRLLADAGRHPSIYAEVAGEISTIELIAQAVRCGAGWESLGESLAGRLCRELGVGTPTINHLLARSVRGRVPVNIWRLMRDGLAERDSPRLENLLKEYFDECLAYGIEADAEMMRQVSGDGALSLAKTGPH